MVDKKERKKCKRWKEGWMDGGAMDRKARMKSGVMLLVNLGGVMMGGLMYNGR